MRIRGVVQSQHDGEILFQLPCPVYSPYGNAGDVIRVVGEKLPTTPFVKTEIEGIWEKDEEGIVFKLTGFAEIPPKTDTEVFAFLRGHGVSKSIANQLISHFGTASIQMLDEDMDYAMSKMSGKYWMISSAKKAWAKFRNEDLFAYLSSFELSDNTIQKLYDRYGKTALHVVKTEPYSLLESAGIPFSTADKIARANHVGEASHERLEAAMLASIREAEGLSLEGHKGPLTKYNRKHEHKIIPGSTCLRWEELCALSREILHTNVSGKKLADTAMQMEKEKKLFIHDDTYFFRMAVAEEEMRTAKNICRLLKAKENAIIISKEQLSSMQDELVNKAGLAGHLSEEQQEAVRTCLEEPVSVITGGPGTGKTTIQTAILYLIKKYRPQASITMIAPTGRAAARMTESSGYPAATIHSALGLYGSDEYDQTEMIKSDVLVIDEFSMVDASLADKLFASVNDGSKVICLGDVNQLPSVGAGSVLRELIFSGVVPTAVLTGVFRQKKGSSIAENAYKVNDGKSDLQYDDACQFIETDEHQMQDAIAKAFMEQVKEYGLDNVCVLTPLRRNTETGVNQLNKRLQSMFEHGPKEGCYKHFDTLFYCGDKVMYTKNSKGLANGDVGRIIRIENDALTIDFGKSSPSVVKGADLDHLVLAYACTVHKSQGSEYESVILVLDERHSSFTQKAIVYTAITRARKRLLMVGQRTSLNKAVLKVESVLRQSRLAEFLQEEII